MPKPKNGGARYLYDRYVAGNQERETLYEQDQINALIAMELYALREKLHLTQAQLAKKVGTTQSVISRLEDADYEGHSVSMLQRIAAALGHRVVVSFVPMEEGSREIISESEAEFRDKRRG